MQLDSQISTKPGAAHVLFSPAS